MTVSHAPPALARSAVSDRDQAHRASRNSLLVVAHGRLVERLMDYPDRSHP